MLKKRTRINKIMDKKENNEKVPNYAACAVSYYDPQSENKDFCMMAFTITDLRTDKIVFQKEYWTKDCKLSPKEISDETLKMIEKYNAKIFYSKENEPLEKCQDCDGYYINSITRESYLAMKDNVIKITQGEKMKKKKKDKFSTKLFDNYEEFADDTFEKMDDGWDLPLITDDEYDAIHQMARDYLIMVLEENDEAPEGEGKSIETLNEMYQLLFKLNMMVPDEDDEDDEEDKKEGEITSPSKTVENITK
jgi:hypothetical protein